MVRSKLSSWKCEILTLAAKKMLLQSVFTAMPWFILANSWVPKSILEALDKEYRRFLWGMTNGP